MTYILIILLELKKSNFCFICHIFFMVVNRVCFQVNQINREIPARNKQLSEGKLTSPS